MTNMHLMHKRSFLYKTILPSTISWSYRFHCIAPTVFWHTLDLDSKSCDNITDARWNPSWWFLIPCFSRSNPRNSFVVVVDKTVQIFCYEYFTAILYRASTGPEEGFPCVIFPHREKPVFNTGRPGDENRLLPVRNTTQGKPCFH